jgi:hypothetical protein
MLVVPLTKDVIHTIDGTKYRVVEYTNFKSAGPAVYAKLPNSKAIVLVYFPDIDKINGTLVEYKQSSKVFNALGKVKRVQQLPQPEDTIKLEDETEIKVKNLKLKAKHLGATKGLLVKDVDDNYHGLHEIIDIIPALGTPTFNKEIFMSLYSNYIG